MTGIGFWLLPSEANQLSSVPVTQIFPTSANYASNKTTENNFGVNESDQSQEEWVKLTTKATPNKLPQTSVLFLPVKDTCTSWSSSKGYKVKDPAQTVSGLLCKALSLLVWEGWLPLRCHQSQQSCPVQFQSGQQAC